MSTVRPERLWTVKDVSDYLGIPVATLYRWRYTGIGPKSRRIGKHLRYVAEDVFAWVQEQEAA